MTGKDQERKEAIKYIENQIRDGYIDLNSLDEVEMDIITCALKQYEQQKWTPCSERLPGRGEYYLVTKQYFGWNCTEYREIDIAKYDFDGWHKADNVLAWCELPKPYQEDSK